MFKLVVLFALMAIAAAKPSLLHTAHVLPAAVSHTSRVDVHAHVPAVATVVAHAAPAIAVAPAVVAHHLPAAVSHQSRVDVVQSSVHAVPVVQAVHAVHAVPAVHGIHGIHGGHW